MTRDERGRFKRGASGNPQGRPQGIRDKRIQARELFEAHAEELKEKALERAREGDTAALRLCLDRIAPPLKAVEESAVLPDFDAEAPLAEQARQILEAAARGAIAPATASTLMTVLQGQARVAETDELTSRIDALERAMDHQS